MMKVLKWCALCLLILMLALGCAVAEEQTPVAGEIVDLPEQIDAGADLEIHFEYMGSPSNIGFNVYRNEEDGLRNWCVGGSSSEYAETRVITVSGRYLREPGSYEAQLYFVDADGNRVESEAKPFTVLDTPLAAAPQIEFEQTEILEGRSISFYTDKPYDELDLDFNQISGERPESRSWSLYHDEEDDESCYYVISGSREWPAGEYEFVFYGRVNGQWTEDSETYSLTIVERPKPTYTLPEAFHAGEDIVVGVQEVPGIEGYSASLSDEAGNRLWSSSFWDVDNSIVIPGYAVDPGSMTLTIWCTDEEGEEVDSSDFPITVTGERAEAPTLTDAAGQGTYLVGENIGLDISGEYERVALRLVLSYYDEEYDETYTYTNFEEYREDEDLTVQDSSECTMTVSASGLKDGAWTAWSEPVALTIDSYGALENPHTQMGPPLEGRDLTVRLDVDENAESIEYDFEWLNYEDDAYETLQHGTIDPRTQSSFTIDAAYMQPGHYGINIIASAPGYESGVRWLEFTVGKLSILPDDLKAIEDEAFANSDMQAVIIPDGCQSIGAGAFRDCEDMSLAIIPASVTSIADDAFENTWVTIYTTPGSAAEAFVNNGHEDDYNVVTDW